MVVLPVRWWFESRLDEMGYENTTKDFFFSLFLCACRVLEFALLLNFDLGHFLILFFYFMIYQLLRLN